MKKLLSRIRRRLSLPPCPLFLRGSAVFGFATLVLSAGCRTTPPAKVTYSFFPPPPDEPRVQFLTSYSSDADIGSSSRFAEFVTGKSSGKNVIIKPYGVTMKDGRLFVCDTMAGAVHVFDLVKKRAQYFAPRGEGRLQMPINITIDADGTRYIADSNRGQVLVFGKDDQFISAIGTKDEMRPCDVAITADRLYVADVKGHAVRVYSKGERQLLFTIPRDPKANAEGKLLSPTNVALDRNGRLVVSDIGGFAVQIYDLEGKHLRTIGQQGVAPGLFARPKGVAADRSGLTYVVDAATQVVQIFDAEGKLLLFFGQPGASTRGELSLPAAVELDYDNVNLFQKFVAPGYKCEYLILVTSQTGPQKVNVYGFLQKK